MAHIGGYNLMGNIHATTAAGISDSAVVDDHVMPEQWLALTSRRRGHTAEQNLWFAVLEDAIRIVTWEGKHKSFGGVRAYVETLAWFASHRKYTGSFEFIMDVLGIGGWTDKLRRKVAADDITHLGSLEMLKETRITVGVRDVFSAA